MSVYITGDCHANWQRFFAAKQFIQKGSYIIVCGDFGIWHDEDGEESYKLDKLSDLGYTILFVSGNHENFDRLYSDEFPVVDFCGGKAQKIRDNIYHLLRGNIYEIEGKKYFAFGGASSHDIDDGILDPDDFESHSDFSKEYTKWWNEGKMFRVKGYSWWERELPTDEEYNFGLENLKKHGNEVDYIISHCLPQQVASVLSHGTYKTDELTSYFNKIMNENKFTKWYCGHYHTNTTIMGKFEILYQSFDKVVE